MKKANFTRESRLWTLIALCFCLSMTFANQTSAQCALACNGHTQVSLDENCEAEITPAMIINADTTICPNGSFEVIVSYHGRPIATSPIVTCEFKNHTLTVMVRDIISGNSCWGEIYVEDKLAPEIECVADTIFCYEAIKYPGPYVTDNCTRAALVSNVALPSVPAAMDDVFGIGNWDQYTYADPFIDIFNCKHDVIYVDGFFLNGPALRTLFNTYRVEIEAWVSNGGRLYINGGIIGGTLDLGFGGVGIGSFAPSFNAIVTDPTHAVFNGPYCPSGSNLQGLPFFISTCRSRLQ